MYNIELLNIEDGSLKKTIKDICSEYGVKGDLIFYKNEPYIIAGLNELPMNPISVINRNNQSDSLFYSDAFAIKIDNQMKSIQELVDYCFKAEFIKTTWTEFECPIPKVVREQELYSLINFNSGRHNPNFDVSIQTDYALGVQKYFKNENKRGIYSKWRNFYRSERYDIDGSLFKNIMNFLTRKKQIVELDKLQTISNEVKRIEMEEHHYQEFKDYMKTLYPNIPFSVSKKFVIDHGKLDDKNGIIDNPWKGVRSYWEYRDITFRSSDEYIIAEAFNSSRLSYATDYSIYEIKQRGPVEVAAIPINDFFNFASLAKQNNMAFAIDKGDYASPSLDMIYIVYNNFNKKMLDAICKRTLYDAVQLSHSITPIQVEYVNSLQERLNEANYKNNKKALINKKSYELEK